MREPGKLASQASEQELLKSFVHEAIRIWTPKGKIISLVKSRWQAGDLDLWSFVCLTFPLKVEAGAPG